MVIKGKHLEELQNISAFNGDIVDDFDETDAFSENIESELAWRRSMIESAANNVKDAKKKGIDLTKEYSVGCLVFDDKADKFARVIESSPEYLHIKYFNGKEKKLTPKNKTKKKIDHSTGKDTDKSIQAKAKPKQAKIASEKKALKKSSVKKVSTSDKKNALSSKTVKTTTRASKNTIKKTVRSTIKRSSIITKKTIANTQVPANNSSTAMDPINDPNNYIKHNYKFISNKELGSMTGLSEHTVRRKLSEWGLSRKKIKKL